MYVGLVPLMKVQLGVVKLALYGLQLYICMSHTGVFILLLYYVIIMKVVTSCCMCMYACEAILQFITIPKEVVACMLVEALLQFITIHIRKYVLYTVQ